MTPNPPHTSHKSAQRELDELSSSGHFHPLDAIGFFRRWPHSFLRSVVYTLIFNLMFAVGFTMVAFIFARKLAVGDIPALFLENAVISNVIGFAFWLVIALLRPVLRHVNLWSFWWVTLFYATLGTGIVTLSLWGFAYVSGRLEMLRWIGSVEQALTSFVISLIVSIVLAAAWARRAAELEAQIAIGLERERAAAAERAAAEANLRALQAQIEPHFLFNTLANVTSLIHTKPDDAKRMLEDFIAYLRSTLAATREANTTLGSEFAMMKRFLSILQIRMGERLHVHFDLPPELSHTAIPPMLLQPLIENAIKHGLEPKIEGGSVALAAVREGSTLRISIIDTGQGFGSNPSNGIGLKNVRERIAKLFGDRGNVLIAENMPCGTRVVLILPYTAQT